MKNDRRQTERETDKDREIIRTETNKQMDRAPETDRQSKRLKKTDRQTDKQAETEKETDKEARQRQIPPQVGV